MDKEQRYEVDKNGKLVIDVPHTTTDRKTLIAQLFSRFGWQYELVNEISQNHFFVKVSNNNLGKEYSFHLYHGNVRKEDPNRNREEKKIQLGGTGADSASFDLCPQFFIFDQLSGIFHRKDHRSGIVPFRR